MKNFIVAMLLLISFMVRPSAIGSKYTSIGIILSICVLFAFIFIRHSININKYTINILNKVFIVFMYLLLNSVMNFSENIDFMLKATIANVTIVLVFTIIFSDEEIKSKYFKSLINIFSIFTISYCITLILSKIINIEELLLIKTNLGYSESINNIYFPITPLYTFMTSGDQIILRSSGLFREAGIYQMYLIWAYFYLNNIFTNRIKLRKIIIFGGIISTFSTSGIFIFMITLGVKKITESNKKNIIPKVIVSSIVLILSIIVLLYTPYIGLSDKMTTHSTSITDRLYMMIRGAKLLLEHPFGTGLYNVMNFDIGFNNTGINLIASSYKIGIIGLTLIIWLYISPINYINNKSNYIVCIIPILITLIFMQPILDAPFVYILLMADYNNYNINKHCINERGENIENILM